MNTYCTDVQEAETHAIYMSLKWTKQQQWESAIVSSDCKNAIIEEIGNKRVIISNTCNVVYDCRELLQGTVGLKLWYEGRETNRIACALAKYAKERATIPNSLQVFPFHPRFVVNIIKRSTYL